MTAGADIADVDPDSQAIPRYYRPVDHKRKLGGSHGGIPYEEVEYLYIDQWITEENLWIPWGNSL